MKRSIMALWLVILCASVLPVVQCSQHVSSSVRISSAVETIREGYPVVLNCTFEEDVFQSVSWFKDGVSISTEETLSNGRTLSISSANDSLNTGVYQCAVLLADGARFYSNVFTLTVKNFNHLELCSPGSNHPVYRGEFEDEVVFKCCYNDPGYAPTSEISWRHIDSSNNVLNISSLLVVDSVSVGTRGVYECSDEEGLKHSVILSLVGGGFLGQQTHVVDVELSVPGAVVCAELGGIAVLQFDISGDVYDLTWMMGSEEIHQDERHNLQSDSFSIYGVQTSDYGNHRIFAKGVGSNPVQQNAGIELKEDCIDSVNINGPSVVSVGVGRSLTLMCSATVNKYLKSKPVSYSWSLPDGTLAMGSTLHLSNVDYNHDGLFRCTADNQYTAAKSNFVNVSVSGPLEIEPVHFTYLASAKLNHTFNITCTTNTSNTRFVWRNDTNVIDTNAANRILVTTSTDALSSTLTINRFTEYDATNYTCEVHSNIHLTTSRVFPVSLTSDIYLLWDSTTVSGINKTSLNLTCPVTGGEGELRTTWLRNNTPVPPRDQASDGIYLTTSRTNTSLLSISSLNLIYEYDMFTCVAEDSRGSRFSKDFKIIVEIAARFKDPNITTERVANVGEVVDLECRVMGKPMPAIIWMRGLGLTTMGKYQNYTNGTFRIIDIQMTDEGLYYCSFDWKETNNPISRFFNVRVSPRQVGGNEENTDTTDSTILGLEQNVFIAIIVAAVGGLFLILAFALCCCLICRFCCCQRQNESEAPRIALETTSFERKPSLRGSYRFKDNSGILDKNTGNPSGLWTFHTERNNNTAMIPLTTATAASSVAVSPGPPIPSPVPTTPAGPTTSMVTSPEFQLPNNVTSFPRQNLKLDNVMGEGEFGPVFKGVARNIIKDEVQSLVAVKVLIPREGEENLWPSLMEFANQMKLSSPHIASIIGICSDAEPYYVIYDYLDRGDLKQFLINSRPRPNVHPPPLTQTDLLHIVTQVSKGMSYLYKQQIIHGDLATRNCLVSSNLTVKIADLGIGHDLYPDDYHDNGAQLLPIRWMSPELFVASEEGPAFSLASDVWSFGIFCWEVFAYARQPYEELSDAQILRLIPEGHTLGAPEEGCPPLLFSIMQDCWSPTVDDRPIFTNVTTAILSIDID